MAGLAGLLLGMLMMWISARNRQDVENLRFQEKQDQVEDLKSRLEQHEKFDYRSRIKELETLLDNERNSAREKIAILEKAEKNMMDAFENLATRIMEEKSKKFTEQNRINISEVLGPLREQLGDFRKKIEDVYDRETRDRVSLRNEITSLRSLNEKMSKDAINLTNALKGDSKKRGNWGEVILERVLEDSGLQKGREYETQVSTRDKQGNLLIPDVVVHLPNDKDVIIDSKVALNAYERYYATDDESERKQYLSEHIASVRNHISGLQKKNYAELLNVNSLDMVLMFVPVEPALTLALEHDATLFQDAFRCGIFLVSPSTLTMNLQIIHNMWRYEYQNQNAREIAKRAGDMYDKLAGFVESLQDVGDKLEKAQLAYEKAYNRLAVGKGNLISRAEAMRKLGIEAGKQLPDDLVNQADTQE